MTGKVQIKIELSHFAEKEQDMKLKKTMSMMKTKNQTTNLHSKPTQKGVTMNIKRLLVAMIAMLFAVSATFAAGTSAGTVITNIAYGNYTDVNDFAMPQVQSEETTTTVAQAAGVVVSATENALSMTGVGSVYYTVTVTNNGNGTDNFVLTDVVTYTPGGDSEYTATMFVDANGNGSYDGGEAITETGSLVADGTFTFMVWVDANPNPSGASDLDVITVDVTATTSVPGSTVADSETLTTTVNIPFITLSKSVSVVGGGQPVPGATLEYTIVVTNAGSGNSPSVTVNDPLAAALTYANVYAVTGDVTSAAFSQEGNIIYFALGALGAGQSATVTFQATIN